MADTGREETNTHGRTLCMDWRGGWLHLWNRRGKCSIPMECGKRYCLQCGPRRARRDRLGLYMAHQMSRVSTRPVSLATYTFRTKWPNETWKDFGERTGTFNNPLPEDVEEWSGQKLLRWTRRWGHHWQCQIRRRFTPAMWMRYMTACWQEMCQMWEESFGERMPYMRVWELTQQGIPHIHAITSIPVGVHRWQMEQWAADAWTKVRGENEEGLMGVKWTREASKAIGAAVGYISKYLTKDYSYEARNSDDDWNTGLRRIAKSAHFPTPEMGDIDRFVTLRGGEVIDVRRYRQAERRAYYYMHIKECRLIDIPREVLDTWRRLWYLWHDSALIAGMGYPKNVAWRPPPERMFFLVVQHPETGALENGKEW